MGGGRGGGGWGIIFKKPAQIRIKNCNANLLFKDTHREKVPSNKTSALRKSTNMGVWAVGTLNQ